MALIHTLRFALSSIAAYRLRSALTALGIVVGVATIVATGAVIEGLNRSFRDQIAAIGTGTLYLSPRPWIVLKDWWRYQGRPDITAREAERLASELSLADLVVPFVHWRSTVEIGQVEIDDVRIIGTHESWAEMSGLEPSVGRFLTASDIEAARPVAAVGADLAEVLAKEGIQVGGYIRLGGRKIRVVGTMPSRGSIFGRSQDDFLAIPLPLFERLFGGRRSLQIGVVYPPELLDRGEDELIGTMRTVRGLGPEKPNNFSVNRQEMFVELYQNLTRALYAAALGLALITLVVGGVGIMNIMLVAVAERTQEIGLRKALGAPPRAVLSQFLGESALISGLGGLAGTLAGLILAALIDTFSPLPASVPFEAVVVGVGFGFGVGVLFGFLPAYRASRLVVVDALRAD